ncbi:MAG: helix-turn-helix domain-containing protein [Candidatus Altiarchaeota archaeon]|nr:helix-turn-helix domain-containing protein [Candidatus Altiarchaeota archaeon]
MITQASSAAKAIAGEITLSDSCADSMKRWRQIFGLKQTVLARRMSLSPSVISDYESGRRTSPGTCFVKRYVESLVDYDMEHGGAVVGKFMTSQPTDAIKRITEFDGLVPCRKFLDLVDGVILANKKLIAGASLRGYTVIDSISAILNFSGNDFQKIYGMNSQRALVFTKVKMGRSPMIAVKVTQPKPGLIVLHGLGPESVDDLAIHIAEKEKIPLVISRIASEEELIERLRVKLG